MSARQTRYGAAARTPTDVLAGIAAVLALAVLVAGVPLALVTFVGWPFPRTLPTLETLTEPIGVGTLVRVLAVLVWLAWAQLVACVAVEVYAGVRGVGLPARVPLAWGTQALVHRLVAAALLLFAATGSLAPATGGGRGSAPAEPRPPHAAVELYGAERTAQVAAAPASVPPRPTANTRVKKRYTVQPPRGRHHESLWEIAERHLGDGRRYKEIYELNKGKRQPDGDRLTIASLIRPGWVLDMPHDATGPGLEVIREHEEPSWPGPPSAGSARDAASGPGHASHAESASDIPTDHPGLGAVPGGGHGGGPGGHGGGPGGHGGGPAGSAGPSDPRGHGGARGADAGPPGDRQDARPPAPQDQHAPFGFPHELAAATLLAAGVLVALGRRRRQQLWHRAFGTRVRGPEGEAALAEEALRIGAAPGTVRFLDLALRTLSRALAGQGRTPPTVYAAYLSAQGLDLWIAPPDRGAPAPWTALDAGQVWRLPPTAARELDEGATADVLAPYPGLVSLGVNDRGRVLVDLEAAHGLIALRGPERLTRAALAALAVELATNRWSDHMRVTLVGFGGELTLLAPERVRAVASLAEALPELEARAEETRRAFALSGVDSVLTGRCRGVSGEVWMPHYLLMAAPPTAEEVARLTRLARTGARMAAGYVVAADVPEATWTWDIDEDGVLRTGVLGLEVRAQLLPERQYASVVELFKTASRLDGLPLDQGQDGPGSGADPGPGPAPGSGHDGGAPGLTLAGVPDPRAPAAVDVRLLGRLEVDAPGELEEGRRAACAEIVAYLATHPEGVHPTVLGGAVWPRGVSMAVRDATVARTRDWLGRDHAGRPNLAVDEGGRLRLGPEVRVDLAVFRALLRMAARDPAGEQAYLAQALDLVRGPLLEGRPRARYAWLAADELEYDVTARVADAAHRLVELRLRAGDAKGAVDAARRGLRLAADDEMLWRDLLRASHATGDVSLLRAVVGELRRRVAADPVLDEMQPETEALVDELLPSWRLSVAN